jgi:hypothetical protein
LDRFSAKFLSHLRRLYSEVAGQKILEVAVNECYAGEANSVHPVFPKTVYHLDMPRMRIVTIQSQDKLFLLDSFIKQTKYWNNWLQLSFCIRPAL